MKKLTIPLAENAIAAKNNDRDGEWAVYVEASAPDAQLKEACKMIPGWGSERFTCFEVRIASPRCSIPLHTVTPPRGVTVWCASPPRGVPSFPWDVMRAG